MSQDFNIARRFKESSRDIFVIDASSGSSHTYSDIEASAISAASFLMSNGVPSQGRVAILCANSADFLRLYFAALLGGFTAVPVNLSLPKHDIDYILESAMLSAAVMDAEGLRKVPDGLPGVPCFNLSDASTRDSMMDSGASLIKPGGACANRLFSISYTSGTTSSPKGVAHSVKSLLSSAAAFNKASGIDASSRMLHVLPMAYMAGFLNTILCPFAAGASILLKHAFNAMSPLNFWQDVFKHQANTFWLVPAMMSALVKLDRSKDAAEYCRKNSCKTLTGTAALPLRLKLDFEAKYSIPVYESYGLSETLFIAANGPSTPYLEGSVGKALDGAEVSLDPASGEALAHVPWLMKGYFKDGSVSPPETSPSGGFPTGDIAQIGSGGLISITGRIKDIIIRGGANISPRAIEDRMLSMDGIDYVAVVGIPHKELGEEAVAAVVPKNPSSDKAQFKSAISALCRKTFSQGYGPDRIEVFDSLPAGSTGKVQKSEIRRVLMEGQS